MSIPFKKARPKTFYLKENDIIMVPRSGTKTVGNEVWDFLKGRIGGVSFGAAF